MIGLSKRLQTICDMVRPGARICDVGCDHAYVDIRLLQENKIAFALAMDVADGPLATARSNLELTKLYESGRCELRKSDGLAAYKPGEADCMICAGMGGILMVSLLEAGQEKAASFEELLLSPQSELHLVREWLQRSGFVIAEERFLADEGKYYTVMRAIPEEKLQHPRPWADWEQIAGRIQALPQETVQKAGIDTQTLCKMLRSPAFQSLAEKTYGPCILKLYLERGTHAADPPAGHTEPEEETACCFERFLAETIRSRFAIAENLNQKLEELGPERGQNLVQRLQDIQTEIGVLQTLLAARTLYHAGA